MDDPFFGRDLFEQSPAEKVDPQSKTQDNVMCDTFTSCVLLTTRRDSPIRQIQFPACEGVTACQPPVTTTAPTLPARNRRIGACTNRYVRASSAAN